MKGYGYNMTRRSAAYAQTNNPSGQNSFIGQNKKGSKDNSTFRIGQDALSKGGLGCDVDQSASGSYAISRSCLSELRLFHRPKEPSLLGFRQPTEEQYKDSRKATPKMFKMEKDYYSLYNKQRDLEFFSMVLAMIGLFIGIINYEKDVDEHKNPIDMKAYRNAMDHPRNASKFTQICRMTICITTVISIIILVLR